MELCCVQALRARLLPQRDLAHADWQGLCAVGGAQSRVSAHRSSGSTPLLTPSEQAFSFPGARDPV